MSFKIAKSKFLLSALELVLVIGLAYLMAKSFWLVFTPSKPLPSFSLDTAKSQQASKGLLEDKFIILSAFNPFNQTAIPVSVNQQPTELAPETSLDLKLLGVRQNLADTSTGSAIIRLPSSKERVFSVGEEIINDVSLREIYTTHITIARAGSIETLYLEGVNPDEVQRQIIRTASASTNTTAVQTIERSISIEALTDLATGLNLSPNDTPKGLKVTDQDNLDLLRSIGLLQDDIINSVNGSVVTTNDALLTAISKINPDQPLRLRVIRDTTPIKFLITLTR